MEHWVSFPQLGWTFPLPQTVVEFSLFGLPIHIRYYGLLIAVGFLLAILYAYKRAPQLGINRDRMIDVVLVAAVVGVLCARLYYVLFADPGYYFSHPDKILAIWDGGLAIYGGLIGGFGSGLLMCRFRKVNALALFDLAAIGFLIGQSIGRWGNFFNQEAYGGNTTLPWGMTGDQIQSGVHGLVEDQTLPVHPTFLYESLWCALGILILHILFKKAYKFNGQIFAGYLIWYGGGRALIESLRADSLYLGPIRISQLVGIVSVVAGIGMMIFLAWRAKRAGWAEIAVCTGCPTDIEEITKEEARALREQEEQEESGECLPQEEEADSDGHTD
ncbi:MAG: prolipoprotein diacylglyceryl transferase [Clostridia bacterium]|nr:prolipoprotein diacylglyceryl transferase [Clostridia bacterium]